MITQYKFQKLAVYQMALDFIDEVYSVIPDIPKIERYNLCSQIQACSNIYSAQYC